MLIDRLAGFAGLTPQPRPGTPDFDVMVDELAFAITCGPDTPEGTGAAILRFMLRRGYWPLGTRVTVDCGTLQPTAHFPLPPAAARRRLAAFTNPERGTNDAV